MDDKKDPQDITGKKKSKFAGALAKIEKDLHALQTGGDGLARGSDFQPNLPPVKEVVVLARKVNKITTAAKSNPAKPTKLPASPTSKR